MKFLKLFLIAITSMLMLSGCIPDKPAPSGKGAGPSMMYQPAYGYKMPMKYPLKVGIMMARDSRPYKFFDEQDEFFKEPIPSGFSKMMYQEFKNSGLFKETVFIDENLPKVLDQKALKFLALEHNVDMILVSDLIDFNLLRKKEGRDMMIYTYNLIFNVKTFTQLIHLNTSTVVWADVVSRESKILTDGSMSRGQLSELTAPGLKGLFGDMRQLISTAGLEMK